MKRELAMLAAVGCLMASPALSNLRGVAGGGGGGGVSLPLGQDLTFSPSGSFDIGQSGDNKARSIYITGGFNGNNVNINGFINMSTGVYTQPSGQGILALYDSATTTTWNRVQFGGTDGTYPSLKRFGNALANRTAADTVPTFSTLTACASGGEGATSPVSDSTTVVWGATVTGGGANHVLAYCNGTNWTVAAK